MKRSAEIAFEIPFHDVDMMGVVWHGHYYKYFELARTELFRQFRCDAGQLREMGFVLPVIDSHCRYVSPLTYGMRARVVATLVEMEFRLRVDYLITEFASGRRLARGNTVQVVVRHENRRLQLPVPLPIARLFDPDFGGSAA